MKTKKNSCVQSITRTQAASFIDGVLHAVMVYRSTGDMDPVPREVAFAEAIRFEIDRCGLEVPYKCAGEAHSNPNIDHCGVCMPNWGIIETEIKVR